MLHLVGFHPIDFFHVMLKIFVFFFLKFEFKKKKKLLSGLHEHIRNTAFQIDINLPYERISLKIKGTYLSLAPSVEAPSLRHCSVNAKIPENVIQKTCLHLAVHLCSRKTKTLMSINMFFKCLFETKSKDLHPYLTKSVAIISY